MKHVKHSDFCIRYFGNWKEKNNCFETVVSYNKAYFNFLGKKAKVFALQGPNQGVCSIYLDGTHKLDLNCYSLEEKEVCIFEIDDIDGDFVHNLVVELIPQANGLSPKKLSILGFEAKEPVNYPKFLKAQMFDELENIKNGKRTFVPPSEWKPPIIKAKMPKHDVVLCDGFIRKLFDLNIENLKFNAKLEWYTEGSAPGFMFINKNATAEECSRPGWAGWAPGQIEASELGGAAGVLRWEKEPILEDVCNEIVEKMLNRQRDDGYYNYYDEKIFNLTCFPKDYTEREMPSKYFNYEGGEPLTERKNADRAFWTRGVIEALNANIVGADKLVRGMYDWFNNQDKYLKKIRYGFNATNGDIGGPMVYHSEVGKPEDIITNMLYYDQEYWMKALTERQPLAFSHYPGERPHSTALLCVQALADMYLATGIEKYLNAVLGAWDIYHKYYKHTGGLPAIIENQLPYPPGAYEIYKRAEEACGHTNWMWVNDRLMQIFPENENYIAEIEECMYNTMVNSVQEKSNVYHILLHGKKEKGSNWNSCCQISVQIAVSSLPQYIYTYSEKSTYINLFVNSEFSSNFGVIKTIANFPYSNNVEIHIQPKTNQNHTLNFRIPRWADKDITILLNGEPIGNGKPGSYFAVNRIWNKGDVISYSLPVSLKAILYKGFDQAENNYPKYTFVYGPILMALNAEECKDKTSAPHIKMNIVDVLSITPNNYLHYKIPNTAYTIMPYWDTTEEGFTCLPIVGE